MNEIDDLITRTHTVDGPAANIAAAARARLETEIAAADAGTGHAAVGTENADSNGLLLDLAMGADEMRPPRRTLAYPLAAAAAVVIAVLGVVAVSQQQTPDRSNIAAAPAATETPEPDETPATAEPTLTSESQASFDCAGSVIELTKLDGYQGPLAGPSPDVRDATPGDHSFHWISDTGSIEFRWPAPATDVIVGAAPDTSRKFFVTDVGVFRDRACRVQTTVVDDTQAGMDRGFELVAQLRAPLEPPVLIAASADVAGRPDVIACEGGLANRYASLQWVMAYATPVDALKAFLDSESNSIVFAQSDYIELHSADGTVYFGYEATEPIGTSEQFNQLLIATRSSEGWAITAWETSGC